MRYMIKSRNIHTPRAVALAFARLAAASNVADRAILAIDFLSCLKPKDLIKQQDQRKDYGLR